MRSTLTTLGLALAVCGLATACGSAGDEEGITIYSGRIAPLVGPLIDEIEAREEVDIQTRFGETPQLAATVIEEGGNSPADVFFAQDAGALDALSAEGLLMKLPDDVVAQVPERFRSPAGEWVGTSARARVIAYGEGDVNCSASGRIEIRGDQLALVPRGEGDCRIPLTIGGNTVRIGELPAACAYYCGPGVTMAGKSYNRADMGAAAVDVAGDPLC